MIMPALQEKRSCKNMKIHYAFFKKKLFKTGKLNVVRSTTRKNEAQSRKKS